MNTPNWTALKKQALADFGVCPMATFDVNEAIRARINHLKTYLKENGREAIVLGISGGVDSTAAGKLSQLAIDELRQEGYPAVFVAVRLPSHVQRDEADAQYALDFIQPDKRHTINIGEATDILSLAGLESFEGDEDFSAQAIDFHKGNMKARLRMSAQYQLAAFYRGVVLGTVHNAEGILSFYTKWGDGACDLTVLDGLNKRQVRLVAQTLGAPAILHQKPPTADLEELNEHLLDEESTGIPYDVLDDFLEGKTIGAAMERKILAHHASTAHKRTLPIAFV